MRTRFCKDHDREVEKLVRRLVVGRKRQRKKISDQLEKEFCKQHGLVFRRKREFIEHKRRRDARRAAFFKDGRCT